MDIIYFFCFLIICFLIISYIFNHLEIKKRFVKDINEIKFQIDNLIKTILKIESNLRKDCVSNEKPKSD